MALFYRCDLCHEEMTSPHSNEVEIEYSTLVSRVQKEADRKITFGHLCEDCKYRLDAIVSDMSEKITQYEREKQLQKTPR